ncbi:hypothetical protein HU200_017967 [Digitaria exilis]|uniref:Leucine-rich repeat-containing N-terminal plant-type domain-containing protein n=1 Tax=Digitaria exilis TaxID=1010633 RepID=A0A835F5E3_9POAL|nr:hypothetical protein HU200_017967 [Digitaria exilis]
MPSFSLALVLLLSLSSSCSNQEERSLLQFLAGLSQNGGLAASWRNGTDCCRWEGITCNANREVTEVSLASIGLEGHVSPSIGSLKGMLRLNLSGNSLSGGLPLEVMFSNTMVSLDVSFNRLSGDLLELPSSTPGRPLQVLNISSNFFTGSFPSATWAVLDLSYNRFSGPIPPDLGNCFALRVLKAGYNKITGTLPDELFDATSLEYLSLSNNGLGGTLYAAHIYKLSNLVFLDLAMTGLGGKIPDSIELPTSLSKCTSLTTISLRRNNFQGELTKINFSTLSNLKILDLYGNNFTGTIPESIYSCSNLAVLRLSVNKFHGQLSKSSRNLQALLIGVNFKHEVMAQDETMDGFENLQVLGIHNCSLSGNLPIWLSKLTNLKMLLLANNRLTGPIPSWVNTLHSLFYIDISNNSLTGEIPAALMELPMMQSEKTQAYLDINYFEVPIYLSSAYQYRSINALPQVLNLSYNGLTGIIPLNIGQLGGTYFS